MRVRRNDSAGDWMFGRSKRDYVQDSDAIRQNVETRVRSFANDWLLDTTANIDWFDLLGRKGAQNEIEREVDRVVISTEGVVRVDKLNLTKSGRKATINIEITTIFNERLAIDLGLDT